MSDVFSCRSCKKAEFTVIQMKRERKLLSNNRGICKPCYAEYVKLNLRLKKAKKNPKESLKCDNCDGIFSIYNRGPTQKNGTKKLKTECPYCKSENIDRY
jgi:hypothetical protein